MRIDTYDISVCKHSVSVLDVDNRSLPVTMAQYDALIVALQRWRNDHQRMIEYWGTVDDGRIPEWGNDE